MLPSDDSRSLALLYHLNSKPWLNDNLPPEEAYPTHYADVGDDSSTSLPEWSKSSPLLDAIRARKSCRGYSTRTMPVEELAKVLLGAGAVLATTEVSPGLNLARRSTPSAGALYPLEVYLLLQRVQSVPDGTYRYGPNTRSLARVQSGPALDRVTEYLLDQYWVSKANALIVLSAVFSRTLDKYGARGYRYILFEAGHAAQNVCLLAAEQGLSTLCVGGFEDDKLNTVLGLDGVTHAALYCVAIGYSAEDWTDTS